MLNVEVSTCPFSAITYGSSYPLRGGLTLTIVTILDLLTSLSVYYMIIFIMHRLAKYLFPALTRKSVSPFSTVAKDSKNWGIGDDYEVLASLGKGSSARVFMGYHVLTNEKVVIKIFKHLPIDFIKREININLKLLSKIQEAKHAEFIHLKDTCYDPTSDTFTLIYRFHHGVPLNQLIATIPIE